MSAESNRLLRAAPRRDDAQEVRRIVAATGLFRDAEVEIAVELVEEAEHESELDGRRLPDQWQEVDGKRHLGCGCCFGRQIQRSGPSTRQGRRRWCIVNDEGARRWRSDDWCR